MPIKDEHARREYQRNYARLRRAGLTGKNRTKNRTVTPAPLIEGELRLETVNDYLNVLNHVIADVRSDEYSSVIQKARTVGYLVNIAIRALELGSIEQRIENLEATVTAEAWR